MVTHKYFFYSHRELLLITPGLHLTFRKKAGINDFMENSGNTINEPAPKKIKGTGILIQKAALVIVSDNFFGNSFILEKEETVIGRDTSCDMVIDDAHISGKHCSIQLEEDGHFYLEDLDSSNGTYLNTRKIRKKIQLYYHDRIVIGHTIIRYYLEEKLSDNPE